MKKIFLLALLFAGKVSLAQTEKGGTLVGGSLSLQTTKENSSFVINPNVGLFIQKNLAVGANLNINWSHKGDLKTTELGLGPYVRYYFSQNTVKPFGVAEANYLINTVKTGSAKDSNNGVGFLFGVGFAAFVNNTVALEGIGGYNYSDLNGSSGAGGFTLRFGFQLFFNRENYKALKTKVVGDR